MLGWPRWCQPQRQCEAGPCWQQRPPEELEQVGAADLLRAALPLKKLWHMLGGMKGPVYSGWQVAVCLDPVGSVTTHSVVDRATRADSMAVVMALA